MGNLTRHTAWQDFVIVMAFIWHCFVIVMALFFVLLISAYVIFAAFMKGCAVPTGTSF